MLTLNDLWCGDEGDKRYDQRRANCVEFHSFLQSLPEEVAEAAHQPNPKRAPWHVKFDFGFAGVMDVWPHKRQYQKDGAPAIKDFPRWSQLRVEVGCAAAHYRAVTGKEKVS